jgi:hypothetical protein
MTDETQTKLIVSNVNANTGTIELERAPKEEIKQTDAEKELLRLQVKFLKNRASMASDYKNTIKHTGGLLSQSMTFAYAKGLNDAFKLLTKEEKNEKPV